MGGDLVEVAAGAEIVESGPVRAATASLRGDGESPRELGSSLSLAGGVVRAGGERGDGGGAASPAPCQRSVAVKPASEDDRQARQTQRLLIHSFLLSSLSSIPSH